MSLNGSRLKQDKIAKWPKYPIFGFMKKLLLLLPLLIALKAGAQRPPAEKPQRDSLPYQKYPTLPAFNILLQDSATIVNTYYAKEGKPVVLVFFSPDCDHCQQFTKSLASKMDSLKDVQVYLFTPMYLSLLRPFAKELKLADHKNVVIGKDFQYFFPSFYGANYVPYVAVYDRKKKFVKMWEGKVKIEELMDVLQRL